MLDQRGRRWADVVQMLYKCFRLCWVHPYQCVVIIFYFFINARSLYHRLTINMWLIYDYTEQPYNMIVKNTDFNKCSIVI